MKEIIVYDSLGSYRRPGQRSELRKWVEGITGNLTARDSKGRFTREHVISGTHVIRQNLEAGGVGGALAYADVHLRGGLDQIVAIDGAGAVLANAASVFLGGHEVSRDLVNLGSTCTGIYSYRKVKALLSKMEAAGGGSPGYSSVAGESDKDPITAAASKL